MNGSLLRFSKYVFSFLLFLLEFLVLVSFLAIVGILRLCRFEGLVVELWAWLAGSPWCVLHCRSAGPSSLVLWFLLFWVTGLVGVVTGEEGVCSVC